MGVCNTTLCAKGQILGAVSKRRVLGGGAKAKVVGVVREPSVSNPIGHWTRRIYECVD